MEDASAEAPRLVPPEVPATVKPVGEPAGNEAPGVVPPEMSDEILDWLVNDDVLEERLLKEMRDSMKRVHNHHVKLARRSRASCLFWLSNPSDSNSSLFSSGSSSRRTI